MSKHAVLSASASYRWLECLPSARLEQKFDHEPSEAALQGTAAHALCEHKLKRALKQRSKRPTSKYDSDEMEKCTDDYVKFVMEQLEQVSLVCEDPIILIEQHLDMTQWVPEGFGTGDCVIVADQTLHIIDFKYGVGVVVEAEHNTQMMLYALGALNIFDSLYDIKDVAMTIFQPRRGNVKTWTISKEELLQWAENELAPKAKMAFDGEGEYCPGHWCQFCRARNRCRARAERNMKLLKQDYKLPPLLTDSEIEVVLTELPALVKWAEQIQKYASKEAIENGKHWNGFKVVHANTKRRFSDPKKVEEICFANGYKDI